MTHDPSQTPEPNPSQSHSKDSTTGSTTDSMPIDSTVGQEPSNAASPASESSSAETQVVHEVQNLEENVMEEASVTEHGVVEHVTAGSVESKSGSASTAIDSSQTQAEQTTAEQITADQTMVNQAATAQTQPPAPSPNAPSPSAQPSDTASTTATASPASSNKLQSFLRITKQVGGILWTVWLAISPILLNLLRGLWQLLLYLFKGIRQGWKAILPRIRTVLPEGWNKLPDWAITTVAVSLLVLIVGITTLLVPGRTPTVAQGDRSPSITTPTQQPTQVSPDAELIAKVQKQVTEIAEPYSVGLVQAVRTNVQRNTMTVQMNNDWYTLASDSQTRLANDLLKRSRRLDFNTLEIKDPEGELIARSPVVGKKMVIYERVRNVIANEPATSEPVTSEPVPNEAPANEATTPDLEQPERIEIPTATF